MLQHVMPSLVNHRLSGTPSLANSRKSAHAQSEAGELIELPLGHHFSFASSSHSAYHIRSATSLYHSLRLLPSLPRTLEIFQKTYPTYPFFWTKAYSRANNPLLAMSHPLDFHIDAQEERIRYGACIGWEFFHTICISPQTEEYRDLCPPLTTQHPSIWVHKQK